MVRFASFHDVKRWDDNEEEDDKSQQTTWGIKTLGQVKEESCASWANETEDASQMMSFDK